MASGDGTEVHDTGGNAGGNSTSSGNAAIGGSNTTAGPQFFDPGTISGSGSDNSAGTGKRRGRKPYARGADGKPIRPDAGTEKETSTQDNVKRAPFSIDGVSAILLSMHQMLAGFTSVPELEIDPTEASKMAEAIKGVADQYDVKPTEKSLAWINLATATAMVYGTRVFAYRMRKAGERAERAKPQTQAAPVASIVR